MYQKIHDALKEQREVKTQILFEKIDVSGCPSDYQEAFRKVRNSYREYCVALDNLVRASGLTGNEKETKRLREITDTARDAFDNRLIAIGDLTRRYCPDESIRINRIEGK